MKMLKQIMLVFLLATSVLAGCKKETQQSQGNDPKTQSSSKITKQLLSFRNNIMIKNGGSLQADSAVWCLEGLLNLENANNNHQFDGLEFFHDSTVLVISGGSISLTELNDAYSYFTNKIAIIMQSQNNENFAFDAVNISTVSTGLKDGETKLVMDVSGGPQITSIGNYVAFGPTDYWNWGMDGGKCGAYSGQGGFEDAGDKLEFKFNHPLVAHEAGYFTDIESQNATGPSYPDINNPGPYCDTKIFYYNAGNTGIWPCLSPLELNYYLSTFPYIVNDKQPVGKTFVDIAISDIWISNTYFLLYELHYGVFHPSGSGS